MRNKAFSWQQSTLFLALLLICLFVAFLSSLLSPICMQEVPFTAVLEKNATASKNHFPISFFLVSKVTAFCHFRPLTTARHIAIP